MFFFPHGLRRANADTRQALAVRLLAGCKKLQHVGDAPEAVPDAPRGDQRRHHPGRPQMASMDIETNESISLLDRVKLQA